MTFAGRVGLITGAGSGIGRATARILAERGGAVVAADVNRVAAEETAAAIRAAGHTGPILFRPPYGKKLIALPWYLEQTGRTSVMWSIEPESASGVEQTPDGMARHAVERAQPGSIILMHAMHDGAKFKLSALDQMLSGLAERGLRVVSFAELSQACAAPG